MVSTPGHRLPLPIRFDLRAGVFDRSASALACLTSVHSFRFMHSLAILFRGRWTPSSVCTANPCFRQWPLNMHRFKVN